MIRTKSELSFKEAVQKYTDNYRENELFICFDTSQCMLCIEKMSRVEFIIKTLKSSNSIYFHDPNQKLQKVMERLVNNQICDESKNNDDVEQLEFIDACKEEIKMGINWETFAANPSSSFYKLICNPKIDRWVKLDALIKLFPNMDTLEISEGAVSLPMLDNVLEILQKFGNKSDLAIISIMNPIKTSLNVETAISQYQAKFEAINWSLSVIEEDWTNFGLTICYLWNEE